MPRQAKAIPFRFPPRAENCISIASVFLSKLTLRPMTLGFNFDLENCALTSSLFLEIHKVCLRKSAIVRTQILSQFILDDLIIVYFGIV